jgi:hypothetical protein
MATMQSTRFWVVTPRSSEREVGVSEEHVAFIFTLSMESVCSSVSFHLKIIISFDATEPGQLRDFLLPGFGYFVSHSERKTLLILVSNIQPPKRKNF